PRPHTATLSLHDALPISASSTEPVSAAEIVCRSTALTCAISPIWCRSGCSVESGCTPLESTSVGTSTTASPGSPAIVPWLRTLRSEEHTSELQSPYDLVC